MRAPAASLLPVNIIAILPSHLALLLLEEMSSELMQAIQRN